MSYRVGVIIGSIASKSINRRLASSFPRLAPESLKLEEIPIEDLPFYSYDYDDDYPPVAREFKAAIARSDALIFVTPEYNRSIPGVLKNAIDWGSRPYGQNAFAGKPSAVIGTSPGMIGTACAQQHLRNILAYLDTHLMGQPEAYIQFKPGLVNENGEITVESTAKFLRDWLKTFEAHVRKILGR